jgi:cytidine deaminase
VTSTARPRPGWPFARDPVVAARVARLQAKAGPRIVASVLDLSAGQAVVARSDVAALVGELALASARELALLALPAAATLARPPISDYHVGAVGLARSGELLLGGNLEFPGASIHHTVHGEGFVTLRARALGLWLDALAIGEARPCAHCRQVLAEMAWADGLRLIDPFGADVGLWDVYPAAFVPGDLGMSPAAATGSGRAASSVPAGIPDDVAGAFAAVSPRVHAPYSGEPAAVVLRTADGGLFGGAVLESVAFNPTVGPMQDALVAVAAAGVPFAAVRHAWLATVANARVGHVAGAAELLAAVAPGASFAVTYWS